MDKLTRERRSGVPRRPEDRGIHAAIPMADVTVQVTAVVTQQKASSACHGALLRFPEPGAGHEYECTECGQPAARVLGEPQHTPATGTLAGWGN